MEQRPEVTRLCAAIPTDGGAVCLDSAVDRQQESEYRLHMFDSHCHVTDIAEPAEVLEAAVAAGVRSVLTCGYHRESNAAVCALIRDYSELPFALGLHPWFADESVEEVVALVRACRPTAVGEIGLDLWRDPPVPPLERQLLVLETQLQIAGDLGLPVTLHSRKALDAILPVLRNHPRVRGVLHAFGGSYEQLRAFLDLGYYVGIGGAVTRSRAKRARRVAAAAPADRLLLETDAPAIGLDIVEPPDVRPAHLPRVLMALAEVRGVSVDELDGQTDANAASLFGSQVLQTLIRRG